MSPNKRPIRERQNGQTEGGNIAKKLLISQNPHFSIKPAFIRVELHNSYFQAVHRKRGWLSVNVI